MAHINLRGTTHEIDRSGKTICGETYPGTWPTTRGNINCEKCYHISKTEQDEHLAKIRQMPKPCDEPGIPFEAVTK